MVSLCQACLFYGYWRGTNEPPVSFPSDEWPVGTDFHDWWLRNDDNSPKRWRVLVRSVRVRRWPSPSDWQLVIRNTLHFLTISGAGVAWCATEGDFVDPPDLFDPNQMGDGVWAVLSQKTDFACAANIDPEFDTVANTTLELLHVALFDVEEA
jgi:hypothetical protein